MLDAHYAGEINIADYWAVGDTRTESITGIPSGTTGEAQAAQNIDLVIIGMSHDDLSDGSGKAAITVQTKNQLSTGGYIYPGHGSISYAHWENSNRRTWCNSDFKSALPTWLQGLIKPVTKISNCHSYFIETAYSDYTGQYSTEDEVFLLSEYEVLGTYYTGSRYNGVGSDGTQYEYMKTQSNRVKTSPINWWWTRSSYVSGNVYCYFGRVASDGGSMAIQYAEYAGGLVPAFCL